MRPVSALATEPHYVAHLAPIWLALDPDERGRFFAVGLRAHDEAVRLGITPDMGLQRRTRRTPRAFEQGRSARHWLVAGYPDLRRLGPTRRAILVEHGAGQTYGDSPLAAHFPGGPGRDRVDVFLCPSERVAAANLERYPKASAPVIGCPHVERLAAVRAAQGDRDATVMTFAWDSPLVAPEARSAFDHYAPELPRIVRQAGGVLGHGHPRAWDTLRPVWIAAGATPCLHEDVALARARIVVADNTSALWEAVALDIPVVVLNAPWFRRDVEHGLRFWEYADVGIQVDGPDDLIDAIGETIARDPCRDRRRQVAPRIYEQPPGGAADAAAVALRTLLH